MLLYSSPHYIHPNHLRPSERVERASTGVPIHRRPRSNRQTRLVINCKSPNPRPLQTDTLPSVHEYITGAYIYIYSHMGVYIQITAPIRTGSEFRFRAVSQQRRSRGTPGGRVKLYFGSVNEDNWRVEAESHYLGRLRSRPLRPFSPSPRNQIRRRVALLVLFRERRKETEWGSNVR